MKIHRIEVTNLNSLYGTQAVDLDEDLAGASLFLIQGPTGSGKSTLMDAVSLALFGGTPRTHAAYRSEQDRAAEIMSRGTGECSAEVEFSKLDVASGRRVRYRARWTARRARRDPEGRVQATDRSLEELREGGAWHSLTSDHRAKVYQPHFDAVLEGFTMEDFQRSILLAQGRFDELLRAAPGERAAILERLTDTAVYKEIGERAARLRRAWNDRLEQQRNRLDAVSAVPEEELERARRELQRLDGELKELDGRRQAVAARQEWLRRGAKLRTDLAEKEDALEKAADAVANEAADFQALARHEAAEHAFRTLDRMVALERRIAEGEEAEARLRADLPEREEELARRETDLGAAAARAEAVAALLARLREPATALDGALEEQRRATQAGERSEAELGRRRGRLEDARARATRAAEKLAAAERRVAEARGRIAALPGAELEAVGEAKLQDRVAEAAEADDCVALIDAAIGSCEARRERLGAVAEARAARDARAAEVQAASDAQAKLRIEWAAAREALSEREAEVTGAAATKAERQAALQNLQDAERALDLRVRLVDGEPCLVCGSREHPVRSAAAGDPPAGTDAPDADRFRSVRERIEAAGEALEAAVAARDAQRDIVRTTEGRIAAGEERLHATEERRTESETAFEAARAAAGLDAPGDVERVAERRAAVDALLDDLRTAGRAVREAATARASARPDALAATEAVAAAEAEAGRAAEARDADARALSEARALVVARREAVGEVVAELAPLRRPDDPPVPTGAVEAADDVEVADDVGGADDGAAGGGRIVAWAETLHARARAVEKGLAARRDGAREAVTTARTRLESLETSLREDRAALSGLAEGEFQEHLSTLAVVDRSALEALRLDAARVEALRTLRATLQERISSARGAVQTLRRQVAEHAEARPDDLAVDDTVEGLGERLQEMDARREPLDEERVACAAVVRQAADAETTAAALRRELAWLEERARPWFRLHDLIGVGDGDRFKEFAQALNLRRLLEQANERLQRLNDRYRFVIVVDDDSGLPTLEFEVEDAWQPGSRRSLNTLSGGESFLASLALALGLSDLRTARMPVETLLLDEGFGTLDPETLNTALAALQHLQMDGRQVGIISHVVGLEERVPARIVVEPRGEGRSRVRAMG